MNGAGWCNMARRQVKPQEFLTGFQVDAKTSKKDVSSKLDKVGVSNLTAVIVELEKATYERCCLCNRNRMLRFCLEYFDSEGELVMWADVCRECADRITAERREVQ